MIMCSKYCNCKKGSIAESKYNSKSESYFNNFNRTRSSSTAVSKYQNFEPFIWAPSSKIKNFYDCYDLLEPRLTDEQKERKK
jgi:hypothetical protein